MPHPCTRCGADLRLPTDPSVEMFECNYCGAQQLVSEHAPTREIKQVLARTAEQSQRNTHAVLILAGVIAVAAIVGIVTIASHNPPPSVATVPPQPEPAPIATQAAPVAPEPAKTASAPPSIATLEKSFGASGSGPGQFTDVRNLAVDRSGNLWISDKTGRVQKLSPEGAVLGAIQATTDNKPYGPLSSDIDRVLGIAVDASDRVYVAIGYDVLRYDAANLTRPSATFRGQKDRTCYRDLSLDQAGNLYARSACTDKDVYALVKLDPSGHVTARFDEGPVWMKNATGRIAVDGTGQLWVPHLYESNIQVLDAKGKLVTRFGVEGNKPGEIARSTLRAIALDGKGRLYISAGDGIDAFEVGGRYIGRIPEDRQFGIVRDFAFAPDGSLWGVSQKDVVLRYRITS